MRKGAEAIQTSPEILLIVFQGLSRPIGNLRKLPVDLLGHRFCRRQRAEDDHSVYQQTDRSSGRCVSETGKGFKKRVEDIGCRGCCRDILLRWS